MGISPGEKLKKTTGRILAPTAAADLLFFSVFHQVKCPCGEVDFWLQELQLWLALIEMQFWSPRQPKGSVFFPGFDRVEFWLRRQPRTCCFFSVFHQVKCPCGEVYFWLRELQLWLALIEMQFWYSLQPAGVGFFPFLIGSNFGSDDSRGHVVFFSFSPGEMPIWRGGFWAPRAAVVVGFDSDAVLVPTAARGRWFFPFFDRVEFWLRRQPRTCRFFFSFSPGEMPMWRGAFLAPTAAVVVGFD